MFFTTKEDKFRKSLALYLSVYGIISEMVSIKEKMKRSQSNGQLQKNSLNIQEKTGHSMLEKDIQRSILEYLAWKKIFHYRNNSGAMVSEYKGQKRFTRFGAAGSPDIICVIQGKYIGIEVKNPKAKQSDNQKEFQKNLEAAGGEYLIARSIEDVEKIIEKYQET